MAKGDKSSYSDKQKRQAEHIEESYKDRGVGQDEAESRAWATVNKESGGGRKKAAKKGSKKKSGGSKKSSKRTSKKAGGGKKASRKKASSR